MPETAAPEARPTTAEVRALGVNLPRSAAAFLAMMAALVVIKIVVARWFPDAFVSREQTQVFYWRAIGAFTALGLIGTWFAARTGFPETWSDKVPLKDRLWLPTAVGLGLGAIAILIDALTGWSAIVAQQLGIATIQIRFPGSLVIYPGGALISNIIFYLVPIPLVMWLSGLAMQGRYESQRFWVIGVLCALIEPAGDLHLPGHPGIVAVTFLQDFALNFSQVVAFRRAGFGASVVLRTAFYLVWHVLWGTMRG